MNDKINKSTNKSIEKLIEEINPDWSLDELGKHGLITMKTSSFGCDYPEVSFYINNRHFWICFEHDCSKIRSIEESDDFGRRYYVYERHLFNRIFLRWF